jgi:hypothetical protein
VGGAALATTGWAALGTVDGGGSALGSGTLPVGGGAGAVAGTLGGSFALTAATAGSEETGARRAITTVAIARAATAAPTTSALVRGARLTVKGTEIAEAFDAEVSGLAIVWALLS